MRKISQHLTNRRSIVKYFVIQNSEGDTTVRVLTKEQLIKNLMKVTMVIKS